MTNSKVVRALALACAIALLGAAVRGQGSAAYPTRIMCRACVAGDPSQGKGVKWRPVIGQPVEAFEPWITHVAGGKPVIIQTPRVNLVVAVDGGKVDAVSQSEIYYLRTVSKTLAEKTPPAALDAHELAHLIAIRVLKLEHELVDLLDLDSTGRVKPEQSSDRPVASESVDVFLFSNKAAYDAFVGFRFAREAWPLAGVMLDSGPASAALIPALKDPAAMREITFTTSMQLLEGLSRAKPDLQPWLQVGLAHYLEDRRSDRAQAPPQNATFPPGMEGPKDWGAFIGDLITSGKVGDLGALSSTAGPGLTLRSRLQAWSMVGWMVEKDPKAFAALVRKLLHTSPSEPAQKALLEAIRSTFKHDLVSLVDAWSDAIKKSRASSAPR